MIRALFFACGLFVTLCGGLTACVDRVVLTDYAGRRLREAAGPTASVESQSGPSPWRLVSVVRDTEAASEGREVIDPPDWAAFALLSVGGVTVLYALALPGR
ncbi:MAG TPA: hypothetical protein VF170_01335, partial [Planctomycetaceae bacterium]